MRHPILGDQPELLFRLGPFSINLQTGELKKHGIRIRVQQKPLRILQALLEQPGRLVTREELYRRLWPAGTFVDFDRGLNVAINKLRCAFGDSAESPAYIETVGRLGYRFIGEIQNVAASPPRSSHDATGLDSLSVSEVPTLQSSEQPGNASIRASNPPVAKAETPIESPEQPQRRRGFLLWVVGFAAVLALLVIGEAGCVLLTKTPVRNESHSLPVSAWLTEPDQVVVPGSLALDPHGTRLAFVSESSDGTHHLYLRALDALFPNELSGTEGAKYPFWSPDGNYIGFFANGKLKKISPNGGNPVTIADAPDGRGGAWNRDGIILFAPYFSGPLYRVNADGSDLRRAVQPRHDTAMMSQRWPQFLPDGRHFLFYVEDIEPNYPRGEWVGSLDSNDTKFLLALRCDARFAAPDNLLYVLHGTLVAQHFDPNTLSLRGEPVTVALHVAEDDNRFRGSFAVSDSGSLVFQVALRLEAPFAGMWATSLSYFDRKGRAIRTLRTDVLHDARLSPDDSRTAVSIWNPLGKGPDQHIWIISSLGKAEQLSLGDIRPETGAWSPDGKVLAVNVETTSDINGIYLVRFASSTPLVKVLLPLGKEYFRVTDWSPDGKELLCNYLGGRWQIWTMSPQDAAKREKVFAGNANSYGGRFSPDGRLIAFTSDESGRPEVYVAVRSHPETTRRISDVGGEEPVWSRNGHELYYLNPDHQIISAMIRFSADTLSASAPRMLFRIRTADYAHNGPLVFDVNAEGQFLVTVKDRDAGQLAVIANWQEAVKEKEIASAAPTAVGRDASSSGRFTGTLSKRSHMAESARSRMAAFHLR